MAVSILSQKINDDKTILISIPKIHCSSIFGSVSDLCTIVPNGTASNSSSESDPLWSSNQSLVVPYTGATSNLNMDGKNISTSGDVITNNLMPFSSSSGILLKNYNGDNVATFGSGSASSTTVSVMDSLTINGNCTASYYTGNFRGYISNETERNIFADTFNLTYNSWAYNMTTPAISWAQSQNYLTGFYNNISISEVNTSSYYQHKISCSNILGSPDTDFCTDATGSGSGTSFAKYNFTRADYVSNNTTYYVMNNLTLNLASSGFSVIECELPVWANATTTGVQINASFNGGSASQKHMMEYYSSATAQAICSGITASVSCAPTASGGTILTPYRIHSFSIRNGAGTFTLSLRSELLGNKDSANVTAGSWCRAIEV